LVSLS
jgi:hypothetical protein